MLTSMDSWEYTQWMAYEQAWGPLGGEYDSDALASIQEQLQQIAYLLGQAHFTDKNHKRGPIEKPSKFPRPHDVFNPKEGTRRSYIEEIPDEAEWEPLTEDELLDVHINEEETGEEQDG
jgi:hypothetical protein